MYVSTASACPWPALAGTATSPTSATTTAQVEELFDEEHEHREILQREKRTSADGWTHSQFDRVHRSAAWADVGPYVTVTAVGFSSPRSSFERTVAALTVLTSCRRRAYSATSSSSSRWRASSLASSVEGSG